MKKDNPKKTNELKASDNEIFDPEFKEVISDVINYPNECEIFFEDSEDLMDYDQY